MEETELLKSIRPAWINLILRSLAQEASVRANLRFQMEQFFTLLEQVLDTGDLSLMDSILSGWAQSLTQTDLESDQPGLTRLVREIMMLTFQVYRETLVDGEALKLISASVPCFAYCFEKAACFEMQARVDYVSNQLKQAQQTLEKLDRSKSDFIAIAAHELKTPLTIIEGYTAMLREAHNPQSAPPLELEMLNGINGGTRRLKTIIEDMVDVSLIDNNLMQLHFQPVWINRLLSILLVELEPAIQDRAQTLEFIDFPGCGEMTFGDPERLLQVLRNVLINAVKYTPDGGRIRVDGRMLPGFIEIVIHDTGIGINPEDQSIIFNKFSRLGSTSLHSSGKTKFKGGGPGLGLPIAKGIIEAHGGAIWAESPGHDEQTYPGSTFHILLPLLKEPPDARMARLFSPTSYTTLTEGQSNEHSG